MQQSKRLVILRTLLSRLTGQAMVVDDVPSGNSHEMSSASDPQQKRLEILKDLLRRLAS